MTLPSFLRSISQSQARNVSNTYNSATDYLLTDVTGAQKKQAEPTPSKKRRPPHTFYDSVTEPVASPKKEKEKGKGKAKENPAASSSSTGETPSLRKALGLSKVEARKMALHHMGIAQQLMREADMGDDD